MTIFQAPKPLTFDLVDRTDLRRTDQSPLRVGVAAFERYEGRLVAHLDELERRFAGFVTKDSLGAALQRDQQRAG